MKIICEDKTIDMNKFETVQYRYSVLSDAYVIEVTRHETSGGFFGGTTLITEEIVRLVHTDQAKDVAKKMVKTITKKWISEEKSFDVNDWLVHNGTEE